MHSDAWPHHTERNERKAVIKQLCVYAVGKKYVRGPSDAFCSLIIQFKARLFVWSGHQSMKEKQCCTGYNNTLGPPSQSFGIC